MFPVKGGEKNDVSKKIRKHEITPSLSLDRICVKSCGKGTELSRCTAPMVPIPVLRQQHVATRGYFKQFQYSASHTSGYFWIFDISNNLETLYS